MLNTTTNKKYSGSYRKKPPSNDTEEDWAHIQEMLTTSAQNTIGEKQNERKEEWYDQECQEMIETKWEARLKCIQHNRRANQAY